MHPKRSSIALVTAAVVALSPGLALAAEPAARALRAPFAGHPTVHSHLRDAAHDRLVARYLRAARRAGVETRRRAVRRWSNARLRRELGDLRRLRAAEAGPGAAATPQLQAIAACESGGNPRAIGGGGAYRGLFQFSVETWAAVGGTGDPAAASPAEQYRRAAMLLARAGSSPWPVCG